MMPACRTSFVHVPPVCGRVSLQVLVELWLNQNTYDGGDGDLLAQAQVGEWDGGGSVLTSFYTVI